MNEQPDNVIFFNNCRRRKHSWHYGDDSAFFDLDIADTQASKLPEGQICVVGTSAPDRYVKFNWYSFRHERRRRDKNGEPGKVFFGEVLASSE